MSPEQTSRIARQNIMLTGLVAGIMISLGLSMIIVGLIGCWIVGESFGFYGTVAGVLFVGLGGHICNPR